MGGHKLEIFLRDCQESDVLNSIDSSDVVVKEEPEPDIKTEDDIILRNSLPDYHSDDEVLSVIKKIKYKSLPAKDEVIGNKQGSDAHYIQTLVMLVNGVQP